MISSLQLDYTTTSLHNLAYYLVTQNRLDGEFKQRGRIAARNAGNGMVLACHFAQRPLLTGGRPNEPSHPRTPKNAGIRASASAGRKPRKRSKIF